MVMTGWIYCNEITPIQITLILICLDLSKRKTHQKLKKCSGIEKDIGNSQLIPITHGMNSINYFHSKNRTGYRKEVLVSTIILLLQYFRLQFFISNDLFYCYFLLTFYLQLHSSSSGPLTYTRFFLLSTSDFVQNSGCLIPRPELVLELLNWLLKFFLCNPENV